MPDNSPKVEITPDIVEASAGKYAAVVQWFRDSLNTQRAGYRNNLIAAAKEARWSQATIILLGLIASMAAIFSKPNSVWPWHGEEYWSLLNVIVPLVISATSAIFALLDFRGSYARNSSAYSAVSAVKAQIDYRLLLGFKDESLRIKPEMLDEWDRQTNAAVTQHLRAWERSIVEPKAKD